MSAGTRRRSFVGVVWAALTVLTTGGLLAATIILTSREEVSQYEQGLLQFILFAAGALLTWIFGRNSVRAEAESLIQRDGKKAIRRIVNLAAGIQDFGGVLERQATGVIATANGDGMVTVTTVEASFQALADHIPGQLRTLEDAIQDWRDIVPDEVAQLEAQAARAREDGNA